MKRLIYCIFYLLFACFLNPLLSKAQINSFKRMQLWALDSGFSFQFDTSGHVNIKKSHATWCSNYTQAIDDSGHLLFTFDGYHLIDSSGVQVNIQNLGMNSIDTGGIFSVLALPRSNGLWDLFNHNRLILYQTTFDPIQGTAIQKSIWSSSNINSLFLNREFLSIRHGNGRDWWLLANAGLSNEIYRWLVSEGTVYGPIIDTLEPNDHPYQGGKRMAYSPISGKFCVVYNRNGLRLYDFDRCTGQTMNGKIIVQADSVCDRPFFEDIQFTALGGYIIVRNRYVKCDSAGGLQPQHYDTWLSRAKIGDSLSTFDTISPRVNVIDSGMPAPIFFKVGPNGRMYAQMAWNRSLYDSLQYYVAEVKNSEGLVPYLDEKAVWLGGYKRQRLYNNWCRPFPNTPFDPGVLAGSPCDTLGLAVAPPPKAARPAFSLFPNPATESVSVSAPSGAKTVLLFNALGSLVLQKPIAGPTTTVSVSGLAPGLYRVVVQFQNQRSAAQNLSVVH